MTDFVHLHVHSAYSLLDGMITIDKLLAAAHKAGMRAVAITDHGNMFGALEFYQKAHDMGIKPIIGCEMYVAPHSRLVKEKSEKDEKYHHLVLLARNNTGYKNLVKLVSDAWLHGFYYKPRTDKEMLEKHAEGLIALSACMGGEVPSLILKNNLMAAENSALEYQRIFKGDFFLELQHNELEGQETVNESLKEIGRKLGIPLVATNDVHFLSADDHEAHSILLGIQTQKKITEIRSEQGLKLPKEVWFKDSQTMSMIFESCPEALENTLRIAERCSLEFDLKTVHMPHFKVPEGHTVDSYFEEKVKEGLMGRYHGEVPKEALARAELEIATIRDMNYCGYFLIVWDFIKYAKDNKIPVGPGRGSAAGSIVSYALRITDIDPLKHSLLFERFLNSQRRTLPDIDLDFAHDRRDDILQYVKQKYGEQNVSQIATFGTMGGKSVIRDVARVLEISLDEADRIAKLVPMLKENQTLEDAIRMEPKLRSCVETYPKLFEIAKKLENIPRNASKHAAGVVIADREITDYVPLFVDKKGNVSTQFDKEWVEKAGLIKMDFLGLKTLTVIRDTLAMIKRNENLEIDLDTLDFKDKKTYELLHHGHTIGVFQMEESGFTGVMMALKPTELDDIIALGALYRPGPIKSGMVDHFIKRKHGKEEPDYFHPKLKKILEETYGVIVYQEQIMRITQAMSGFSLGEADDIRRIISKKKEKDMVEQKRKLLDGAVKNGFDKNVAERIIDMIEKFAEYGFNKSHSAAYAYISFQTAWLKAHYPAEFMAALLTNEMGDIEKFIKPWNETKVLKLSVFNPDVNKSYSQFTALKDPVTGKKSIYFCLTAIKGVGEKCVENIVAEREKNGPFKDLPDFCSRVDLRLCNRKVLETLIRAGAFDSLEKNRALLFDNLDDVLNLVIRVKRHAESGQTSLFGDDETLASYKFKPTTAWDENRILEDEKEFLGFYVSSHPLMKYQEVLEHFKVDHTSKIKEMPDHSRVRLTGIVTRMKEELVNGKYPKITFTLEDFDGNAEVELFRDLAEKYRGKIHNGMPVYLDCVRESFNNFVKLSVKKALPLNNFSENSIAEVHIKLGLVGLEGEQLELLKGELKQHPGKVTVYLHFVKPTTGPEKENELRILKIDDEHKCHPTKRFMHFIADHFGEDAYWFDYHIR